MFISKRGLLERGVCFQLQSIQEGGGWGLLERVDNWEEFLQLNTK